MDISTGSVEAKEQSSHLDIDNCQGGNYRKRQVLLKTGKHPTVYTSRHWSVAHSRHAQLAKNATVRKQHAEQAYLQHLAQQCKVEKQTEYFTVMQHVI
jgi:hypothetical protein